MRAIIIIYLTKKSARIYVVQLHKILVFAETHTCGNFSGGEKLLLSLFPILPIFPFVARCRDREIKTGSHNLEQQIAIVNGKHKLSLFSYRICLPTSLRSRSSESMLRMH